MRALRFHGTGDVRLDTVDDPPGTRAGEVLIRPVAVGLCGTDLRAARTGHGVGTGQILGHECAAEVVTVGPTAGSLTPGDRVAVIPQDPCGDCPECQGGRGERCPDRTTFGLRHPWGGLADLALVRARQLVVFPDALSWREAALLEPLSVALHAVRRARPAPGDRVGVVGGGPIGTLAALVVRSATACEVVVHELDETRAALLQRHGLDVASDADRDYDVVVDCAGSASSLDLAVRIARPGATLVVAAASAEPVRVDMRAMMVGALEVRGSFAYPLAPATWRRTAELVASGAVPAGPVADRVIDLAQVPAELTRLAAGGAGSLKTLVAVGDDDLDRSALDPSPGGPS